MVSYVEEGNRKLWTFGRGMQHRDTSVQTRKEIVGHVTEIDSTLLLGRFKY